ncbi:MAG: hypothetical protein ACTSX2_07385 [Candidatus Thorarchaeota archaeon]
MTVSKGIRLEGVIRELRERLGHRLKNCLITNERGLIMATLKNEQFENERAAAMISLASDSAQRISTHIEIAPHEAIKIEGREGTFVINEFLVKDQRYRIGALLDRGILPKGVSFRGLFRRKNSAEDYMREAALKAKKILEE